MPLNLWYYHSQDLFRLEDHLWIGGVICCLLYALMVRVLRNPLFMYAVEAGITLTVLLFLASLSLPFDSSLIAIGFMVMGLMSIHAERAFPPGDGEFRRDWFGLPLFWSGQVQIGISLIAVIVLQMNDFLGLARLTTSYWLQDCGWRVPTPTCIRTWWFGALGYTFILPRWHCSLRS